jgi:hemolysin activation/secretion protein
MLFGSLDYGLPLKANGLRLNVMLSRTQYELGREYASLDAVGIANNYGLNVSYPMIRSQTLNLRARVGLEGKDLEDDYRASDSQISKSIYSLPIALSFDTKDSLVGGGVTYGGISAKLGRVDKDVTALVTDRYFSKFNFDLARIQSLPMNMSFFAKGSAQWTAKNLDSSEDLYMGGAGAVRAYPSGEAGVNGGADYGFLYQIELRYKHNEYAPYAFYDFARVNTAASPTASFANEVRDLAGAGIGLRYERLGWSADVYAAWSIEGGESVSDIYSDSKPRIQGSVTYRFSFGSS